MSYYVISPTYGVTDTSALGYTYYIDISGAVFTSGTDGQVLATQTLPKGVWLVIATIYCTSPGTDSFTFGLSTTVKASLDLTSATTALQSFDAWEGFWKENTWESTSWQVTHVYTFTSATTVYLYKGSANTSTTADGHVTYTRIG
jgi:hypothetical protein